MFHNVDSLVSVFLESVRDQIGSGTHRNYERLLRRFAAYCGEEPVDGLKPIKLMEWGKTWHEVQAVQRLFSWAKDDAEIVARNPFRRVKRPPLGERHRVLTEIETKRLLRKARSDFRAYLLALRESIARPQEIRAVRWVDLHSQSPSAEIETQLACGLCFWVLREYKSRRRCANPNKPRVILISPRLGRLLARLKRKTTDQQAPCFLTFRGLPWTNERARQRFDTLRNRAGLLPDEDGENAVCYSFRHTGATKACAKGLRDRLLADVLGHTKTTTTARYQHLQVGDLQEAMRAVWE